MFNRDHVLSGLLCEDVNFALDRDAQNSFARVGVMHFHVYSGPLQI